jgi:hypothetical protein
MQRYREATELAAGVEHELLSNQLKAVVSQVQLAICKATRARCSKETFLEPRLMSSALTLLIR